MTDHALSPAQIDGAPPALEGLRCEAFLRQAMWFEGAEFDPANMVWLKAGGRWRRFYMDLCIVFWREDDDGPSPPEDESCRLVDLGVAGAVFRSYDARNTPEGVEARFLFADGRAVVIAYLADRDITTSRLEEPTENAQ